MNQELQNLPFSLIAGLTRYLSLKGGSSSSVRDGVPLSRNDSSSAMKKKAGDSCFKVYFENI